MRQDSYISKMEDLERWFELNNAGAEPRPYFTIYRGFESKPDRIIYRNMEISEADKAWELMEDVLSAHSDAGGTFRVFITNKPGFNVGMTTTVKLPNPNPMAAVAGIGSVQGAWGIYGDPKSMIDAELERRMELYELKREVEDMRANRDASVGALNKFFETLVERPELYQLVQHVGIRLMNAIPAMQNTRPPVQQPAAVQGVQMSDHEEGYDYDRIEPALDRLRTVFPDAETTLEQLASWASTNPEMANSLMQNLAQK